MSSYARKQRRKGTKSEIQNTASGEAAEFTLMVTCKILKEHYGRLRRKDTRINRFLEMFNTVATGGEVV